MEIISEIKVKSVTGPKRFTPVVAEIPVQEEVEHEDTRLLNPKQKLAWDSYVNPKSKTFGNAYQSAQHAGYTEGYAAQITTKAWWLEKMRRLRLLSKAERVLDEMLEMPVDVLSEGVKITKDGKIERVPFVQTSSALVKIKQDTSKFIAERLGKDEGYSPRTELSGPGGGPIQISPEKKAAADQAIKEYLEGDGK